MYKVKQNEVLYRFSKRYFNVEDDHVLPKILNCISITQHQLRTLSEDFTTVSTCVTAYECNNKCQ